MGQLRRFNADEERDLIIRAKAGNTKARNQLIASWTPFVVHTVYKRRVPDHMRDDLIQEGVLGLMKALDKFDVNSPHRFITYAHWYMDRWIMRDVLANRSAIRRPAAQKWVKGDESLQMQASLTFGDGDNEFVDRESILADETADQESELLEHDVNYKIRQILDRIKVDLNKTDLDILVNRLCADEPQTLQQIAERHDLTRERIRQREGMLIRRMSTVLWDSLGHELNLRKPHCHPDYQDEFRRHRWRNFHDTKRWAGF